jgi:DNA-binding Lrp family transcriptional regulator
VSPDPQHDAHIVALQQGLPLDARPFRALATTLNTTEEQLLALAKTMQNDGRLRRFGGIFDTPRIATSTLCAINTATPEESASLLRPLTTVTHCYERDAQPNLWFTLTTTPGQLEKQIASIASEAKVNVLNFPMRRRFKLGVILDPAGHVVAPQLGTPPQGQTPLTRRQRQLVNALQGNLPLAREPFNKLARELDWPLTELLVQLRAWQQQGILRRLAVICNHRRMGFDGNLMAVWHIPEPDVEETGQMLATHPQISHCYERTPTAGFPFNLYAMLHAPSAEMARERVSEIDRKLGHPPHLSLPTLREFKKVSPQPFAHEFKEHP